MNKNQPCLIDIRKNYYAVAVSVFFIGAGILHFVLLDFFSSIVPPYFDNPEALVKISGVFEVLGGVGILIERTRKWAGYGLIALCVAVLPANIHMAMNPEQFATIPVALLYLRLPLQALIIWVIWNAMSYKQDQIKLST